MIKLIDILKEITGDASGIWYHGSTANIDQNDLDPLFLLLIHQVGQQLQQFHPELVGIQLGTQQAYISSVIKALNKPVFPTPHQQSITIN